MCLIYWLHGATIKSEKTGSNSNSSSEEEALNMTSGEEIDTTRATKPKSLKKRFECHITDIKQIRKRLLSPSVLFDVQSDQSNFPICLEALSGITSTHS